VILLSARDIVAGYSAHDEVLKRVSINVDERELVVLIGPNGAGKSTLLKTFAGFVHPREGQILLSGRPIHGMKPREIARCGVAFVPQEANVFPSLSVEENLEMGGYIDRREYNQRSEAVYARLPILRQRRSLAARSLSGGQRQTLAVGMALMLKPKLLLLDEPSAGLSPAAADDLFALIKTLHSEGMTIVMVEQNALEALRIADRAYLLVDGKNAGDGIASELAADVNIREAFLGGYVSGSFAGAP
jgi:branched-chain amino acid transport system ATP-binding protein